MKKAFLQLHLAVFLAGFTGVLGRLISLNEGMIVWYRLLFTALTMWAIYGLAGKLQRITLRDILKVGGVGVIAALHWVTFYGSIKYANVSVALVCFSSIGFFTALFEPLILRKKLNWIELSLGLVTLLGIYIIFHFDTEYKTGIIIGVISAVLASLFPIFNRELLKRISVPTLLTWQQAGGFLVLSALLPFYLQRFPAPRFFPGIEDFLWLLFLAWACSVLAFHLGANALKTLSAFTVNLTYTLEPVYGILMAFAIFGENKFLSRYFYAGFALIALAIGVHVLVLLRQKK